MVSSTTSYGTLNYSTENPLIFPLFIKQTFSSEKIQPKTTTLHLFTNKNNFAFQWFHMKTENENVARESGTVRSGFSRCLYIECDENVFITSRSHHLTNF
jgi:hypothetical protein